MLIAILLLATAVRFHDITRHALWVDEYFSLQHSSGNGLSHWRIGGTGIHTPPPDLIGKFERRPLPQIAAGLARDDVHPPLFQYVLRGWRDALGDSDAVVRALPAVLSVVAVALLFDVVRLLHGIPAAQWAAMLAALAVPQIHWAQDLRPYSLLLCFALGAIDAVARFARDGPGWSRAAALAICTLGAGLTHYYGIMPIAGLALYATVRLRGRARVQAGIAFAAAAVVFLALWGPAMWQQRNSALAYTLWLDDPAPGHFARTMRRLALLPVSYFNDPMQRSEFLAAAGAVLFVIPFLLARRRPEFLLWGLWLAGTIVLALTSDLTKGWKQLEFLRYTSLGAPAVYAMVSAVMMRSPRRWLRHALPAAALLSCVVSLPRAYSETQTPKPDWREPAALLSAHASPRDVLVIFSPRGRDPGDPGNWFMPLSRYAKTMPSTVVFLDTPPDERLIALLRDAPAVWTVSEPSTPLPDHITAERVVGAASWNFNMPWLRQWIRSAPTTKPE